MVVNKPKSAFRTISEVAEDIDVASHVLRFWETKFPQLKPMKRNGGRRYYRPDDVELLQKIKFYLYDKRYTIEGVQKLIKEKGLKALLGEEIQKDFIEMLDDNVTVNEDDKAIFSLIINELSGLKSKLERSLEEAE
ncbi:MAG: MerR family transcriptional regulator [Lactobacillaceae bacterium]|jgi:DNA-binding transcriptional MerR regulator|nr:MerR family transcriptional regulator [Lactobacillaceae bacterium]